MKRMISVLLALAMAASLLTVGVCAASGDIEGTYRYAAGHGDDSHDYTQTFVYNDEYFRGSAYDYEQALGLLSLEMACAAGSSSDKDADTPEEYSRNLRDMFGQMGLKSFAVNDGWLNTPTSDSIGVGTAYKTLTVGGETYTLIAVGIRGWNYRAEWGGNCRLGDSGEHRGFAIACDAALEFLREYIADNGITGKIKLWCSGYSRAGAVANLLGGMLDDGYSLGRSVALDPDDLYCYTMEAPKGAVAGETAGEKYGNIHNIINPYDVVPLVAPSEWGFARYGVDHVLPSVLKDADYTLLRDAMLAEYAKLENTEDYVVDDFRAVVYNRSTGLIRILKFDDSVTQMEYYEDFVTAVTTDLASSRAYFVRYLQEDLIELLSAVFGMDDDRVSEVFGIFTKKLSANTETIMRSLTLFGKLETGSTMVLLENYLLDSMREAGVSSYDASQVNAMAAKLAVILGRFAAKNPDVTATLLFNITPILSTHYGEINLAWMRSLPDDYFESPASGGDTPLSPGNVNAIYSDVPAGVWFTDAAQLCCDRGYMIGWDGRFWPELRLTNAQFFTVLYRFAEDAGMLRGYSATGDNWMDGAKACAALLNIEVADWGAEMTRGEMAEAAAAYVRSYEKYSGRSAVTSSAAPFTDCAGSAYAADIEYMHRMGVLAGDDGAAFRPEDGIKRSETATVVMNLAAVKYE